MNALSRWSRFGLAPAITGTLLGLLCGCDDSRISGPTGTLQGTVALDGKPLPAGFNITLSHKKTGYLAISEVEDGRFQAHGIEGADLPVGRYAVHFARPPKQYSKEGAAEAAGMRQARLAAQGKIPLSPIPERYLNPRTSGMTVDVEEGPNQVELTLETPRKSAKANRRLLVWGMRKRV